MLKFLFFVLGLLLLHARNVIPSQERKGFASREALWWNSVNFPNTEVGPGSRGLSESPTH